MDLLSFGEIIWDVYPDSQTIGGAPLNLAAHAVVQGGTAWLASAVGRDRLGETALAHIRSLGIRTDCISVSEELPTGQCKVSLDKNGIPCYRILEDVAYDRISITGLPRQAFDVVAVGTLALRSRQNREAFARLLRERHFDEVYADLNIRPPFYTRESVLLCLSNATIVKISDEELPLVTDCIYEDTPDTTRALEKIAEDHRQIRLILLTQGEKGSLCYDCRTKQSYHCKATPATVRSTVGAGDSYGATFLTWYLKTKDILRSMTLASRVSAFVVAHQEAIPQDIKNYIKSIAPT